MKKFLIFPCLLVLFSLNIAFSQVSFQKLYTFGGTLPMAIAWSAQQTSDGGYIMSGFVNGLPPIRAQLVKTDANGAMSWAKSYGMKMSQYVSLENPVTLQTPFCTRQTSDGGYILCGQLDSRCYLMKVDAAGTTVAWTKQYANNSCGNMVKQLTDGSYIVTGYINDGTKNDSTSIYLAKVASNGNLSWDKMIKVSSNDDDMGNSVEIVSDGFIVTGYTTQIFGNDTTYDVVLIKTDLSGNHVWTNTYGDDLFSEEGRDVKNHSDGSLIITGYTDKSVSGIDGSDLFIIKTNSSGTITWSSAYNIATEDIGHRVVETSTGLAVMGSTISIWGFSFLDMFLMKTNNTGTPNFGEVYSQTDPAHNYMADGQQTADGGFMMAGWGQSLTMDFLLIKTAPDGTTGCDEYPVTPEQRTFNPTEVSITPTFTSIGSSNTKYGMIFTPTVTTSDVCAQPSTLVVEAGNNQSVCVNQSITLGGSPTAIGGSGSYTYTWTPNPMYLNSYTNANPTCTPTTAGTITYTVSVYDGSATSSDVVTITVNPLTTPNFSQLGPYCVAATPGSLPTTSNNSISGTWSPSAISTSSPGSVTYTFTPTAGQCASTTTMSITVNANITPGFTQLGPYCLGATPGSLPTTSNNSLTGTWTPATISTSSEGTVTHTFSPTAGQCAVTTTMNLTVYAAVSGSISGGTTQICYNASPGTFTALGVGGTGVYTYQWYNSSGIINGANNSTYNPGNLISDNGYYCSITSGSCGTVNTSTTNIAVYSQLTALISGGSSPICNKTSPGTFTCTASGGTGSSYTYLWYMNNSSTSFTSSTYNPGVIQGNSNFYCVVTNTCGTANTLTFNVVIAPSVGVPSAITVLSGIEPVSQLINGTTTTTYTTFASNSTGYLWSISNPAAGSIDSATGEMTWTNGFYGTVDIQVRAKGCEGPTMQVIRTVIIAAAGGHSISGKTRYLGKANPGNPVPFQPTYNLDIYNIDSVIVLLKTTGGIELARDTSDASGTYQFVGVSNGDYVLSYDKFTSDTMQWGDHVNVLDIAFLKYLIGCDTLTDSSKNFSRKYKKAADVNNSNLLNVADVAKIKAKVGSPDDPNKNFPRGNWLALDTTVTMLGADMNITLKTVCYGDYNASSSKYRGSQNNWSSAKSLPSNIIMNSGETIMISNPDYFDVPIKISTDVKDFCALGLELSYPKNEYQLVNAYMITPRANIMPLKINPTLEEIILNDNDLLVTDEGGIIRVVYATSDHYDIEADDVMLTLGFRPKKVLDFGILDFELIGTGVIGNQYGMERSDALLIMPKLFIQGRDIPDTDFEFSGYPNPFKNEAIISYCLPENGIVKLSIYNALGDLVSEFVNEIQSSGKHTFNYFSKENSSGLYTIRLGFSGETISFCRTLKMMH